MRFHLYPLSRAFSNLCVFDENAQRFSVDRRPKRIEMYAFSNENALVWTGSQYEAVFTQNVSFVRVLNVTRVFPTMSHFNVLNVFYKFLSTEKIIIKRIISENQR